MAVQVINEVGLCISVHQILSMGDMYLYPSEVRLPAYPGTNVNFCPTLLLDFTLVSGQTSYFGVNRPYF